MQDHSLNYRVQQPKFSDYPGKSEAGNVTATPSADVLNTTEANLPRSDIDRQFKVSTSRRGTKFVSFRASSCLLELDSQRKQTPADLQFPIDRPCILPSNGSHVRCRGTQALGRDHMIAMERQPRRWLELHCCFCHVVLCRTRLHGISFSKQPRD